MLSKLKLTDTGPRPIVPWLKPRPNRIWKESNAADAAQSIRSEKVACSKCGRSDQFAPVTLSTR